MQVTYSTIKLIIYNRGLIGYDNDSSIELDPTPLISENVSCLGQVVKIIAGNL